MLRGDLENVRPLITPEDIEIYTRPYRRLYLHGDITIDQFELALDIALGLKQGTQTLSSPLSASAIALPATSEN